MIAYLDTSATAKLLMREAESEAFATFMASLGPSDTIVSSMLLETELRRMATRHRVPQAAVSRVLAGIDLIEPERDFFHEAGLLPGPGLRSLDALHLTTAISADADVVIAYDRRLLAAADSAGLETLSPA